MSNIGIDPNDYNSFSNEQLIHTIFKLENQFNELNQKHKELEIRYSKLEQENIDLKETIRTLEGRLNMNSTNSSKPSSTDGYKKPNPKSLRGKSSKKPG